MLKTNFIFFLFILFFFDLLGEEITLKKESLGEEIKFTYNFSDALKKRQSITFDLPEKLIHQSYKEIPSLEVLHKKIHTELPNKAYQLAEEYLAPLEDQYLYHLSHLKEIAQRTEKKLGVGFQLILYCPEKFFAYKLEFIPAVKSSYKQELVTRNCAFQSTSEKAKKRLIQKWEDWIQKTKKPFADGLVYELKKKKDGFEIYYEIPSTWSKKDRQKALQSIEKNQKKIAASREDWQKKQEAFQEAFQQVVYESRKFQREAKSLLKTHLKEISTRIDAENQKEYENYYLKVEKKQNKNFILPDYKKIVEKYKNIISGIADSFYESELTERELANKVLNFLQAIPYNDLQQRDLEYFSGFLTPPALFDKNQGDCDSKSIAFLAIAQNLFSNTRSILVLVPKHAFIGLEIQPQKGDETLEHQGITYVLAEPAGPALKNFGSLGKTSNQAMKKNDIEEIIPFSSIY